MTSNQSNPTGIRLVPASDTHLLWAWVSLCLAFGFHATEEATTGFLAVYNSTVMVLRQSTPWLPLPVFRFDVWLAGLIIANALLLSLSPFVFRGVRWIRPIAYGFAFIMFANGIGHTLGTILGRTVVSVRFPRPMPGFYSSPLLLVVSVYLLIQFRRGRSKLRTK
jgi:hypothetical protein